MNLYRVNAEMERLQNRLEWNDDLQEYVDLDTGEIMMDSELKALFDGLEMDKEEALRCLVGMILNDRAEAEAIRAEEKRLAARRKRYETRAERYLGIVDAECGGKKTDLGVATMSYRKSEAVVFDKKDVPDITKWLEENGHDDCLNYKAPEIRKTELKALIKGGVHVPLAMVEELLNGKLK